MIENIFQNTDLDLIHDNRSGKRLELVLPVFNEEKRILPIMDYYKEFDIVLLDGGSTDSTITRAINNGATVYKRVGEVIGENHFVFYINKLSKSNYSFYMMADEFINKKDLISASNILATAPSFVFINKIEWMYGKKFEPIGNIRFNLARGFRKGTAIYDGTSFHNSLRCSESSETQIEKVIYDLHHFHIKSIEDEYGKVGKYLNIEISKIGGNSYSLFQYFKRYVKPVLALLFWRIWFSKIPIRNRVFNILELTASAILALMCLFEKRHFPSKEDQMNLYLSFYQKCKVD